MKISFYIISALIFLIPLLWPIKKLDKFKLTFAGVSFIFLVLVSIAINVLIDSSNNEKERRVESERKNSLKKIDSLNYIIIHQYDTIKQTSNKLQSSFDRSVKLSDSIKNINELYSRPLVKIINCEVLKNGKIELKLVNDSKHAATGFISKSYFIIRPIIGDKFQLIKYKELPIGTNDILTNKDDYLSIDIPTGIFDASDYIDQNFIYFYVQINYLDIVSKKIYKFEYSFRLRKIDNGIFSACYDNEHKELKKFLKIKN